MGSTNRLGSTIRFAVAQRTVPANLRPYIEALGADEAEKLFLKMGGSQVFVPGTIRADERSLLFKVVGDYEKIAALAEALDVASVGVYVKVPLASEWIASRMYERGISQNVIARTIRSDVATVRRWFNEPLPTQLRG
jgi:hypothetical protein